MFDVILKVKCNFILLCFSWFSIMLNIRVTGNMTLRPSRHQLDLMKYEFCSHVGGSDTCLRARASDRTSITLCSNQTLEADTKRCWQADMLDMYTGVKISQEVSKGNCGLPLCFPRAIYGSNPTNNRANHTFDRN